MKYIMLFLLFSTNVFAINNPRVVVESNDNIAMHKENNKNIASISAENQNLDKIFTTHKKCTDKGMVYLGVGASNADDDGCYDVSNIKNSSIRFRPTFKGFLNNGQEYKFYNDTTLKGRFKADKACNSEFPGTRALVYNDLKYVINDMCNNASCSKSKVWVYDTVKSFYNLSANDVISKYAESAKKHAYDCNGWNATSTDTKGMILDKTLNNGITRFNISHQACTNTAAIACIAN